MPRRAWWRAHMLMARRGSTCVLPPAPPSGRAPSSLLPATGGGFCALWRKRRGFARSFEEKAAGMCGIVGYIGAKDSVPIIMDSLRRLEYRGYDSSGIAVIDASGNLCGSKAEGKLQRLVERLQNGEAFAGTTGLGHTRWATHGRPSDANAHPHMDCSSRFAVVHNGIIENYSALRAQLLAQGHRFASETDTEVLAHLIEAHYNGDLVVA